MTKPTIEAANDDPSPDLEAPSDRADLLVDRCVVEVEANPRGGIRIMGRSSTPSGSKLSTAFALGTAVAGAALLASVLAVIGHVSGAPTWLTILLAFVAGAAVLAVFAWQTRTPTSVTLVARETGKLEGSPFPAETPLIIHVSSKSRQKKRKRRAKRG